VVVAPISMAFTSTKEAGYKNSVMWYGNKVWLHYVKNIIAADLSSAVFLASYLRHTSITKDYTASLEIIDLQKYKIITQPAKVRRSIKDRMHIPFVFVVGKN
jgi:hypothetical protein